MSRNPPDHQQEREALRRQQSDGGDPDLDRADGPEDLLMDPRTDGQGTTGSEPADAERRSDEDDM